jgi:DNA repair protein RecO (recombination protein O)
MEHKSRAIILRTYDYGEADRVVTFFTEDFGKQKGVARHARRSKRRFGGGVEPGTICSVRFIERHGTELVRLENVSVELQALKIATTIEKISALHVTLELADRMLPLAHASKRKFGLLERWLNFMADSGPGPAHLHAFYYRWLAESGLAPVFDACTVCGAKEGLEHISGQHGGVVCAACYKRNFNGLKTDADLIKYLQGFKGGKMPASSVKGADEAFEYLLEHALGGRLKALEIVKKL